MAGTRTQLKKGLKTESQESKHLGVSSQATPGTQCWCPSTRGCSVCNMTASLRSSCRLLCFFQESIAIYHLACSVIWHVFCVLLCQHFFVCERSRMMVVAYLAASRIQPHAQQYDIGKCSSGPKILQVHSPAQPHISPISLLPITNHY